MKKQWHRNRAAATKTCPTHASAPAPPAPWQRSLADDIASGIEHTDVMLAITEIQAEGEPAEGSRRSSGNDGRSRRSTAEAEGSSFS